MVKLLNINIYKVKGDGYMKVTEENIKSLGDLYIKSLLEDLLKRMTEERKKLASLCSDDEEEERDEESKEETSNLKKVWYIIIDNDGEFDGIVHKTSKELDIRCFKGQIIEVFDNYADANKKRKSLLDDDLDL